MTVEHDPKADETAVRDGERLHEFAINQLGHPTEDVLVTVRASGWATLQLSPGIGVDEDAGL